MTQPAETPSEPKRDVSVSMRFRDEDLGIIDRGARLQGLSRTEFVRRAALYDAQMAILNETLVRLSPEDFDRFMLACEGTPADAPEAMRRRLSRPVPWLDPERG